MSESKIVGEEGKRIWGVSYHRRLGRRKFQDKVKQSYIKGRGSHGAWWGRDYGPLRGGGRESAGQVVGGWAGRWRWLRRAAGYAGLCPEEACEGVKWNLAWGEIGWGNFVCILAQRRIEDVCRLNFLLRERLKFSREGIDAGTDLEGTAASGIKRTREDPVLGRGKVLIWSRSYHWSWLGCTVMGGGRQETADWSTYLPTRLPSCLCLSIHPFICSSICPLTHLFIYRIFLRSQTHLLVTSKCFSPGMLGKSVVFWGGTKVWKTFLELYMVG